MSAERVERHGHILHVREINGYWEVYAATSEPTDIHTEAGEPVRYVVGHADREMAIGMAADYLSRAAEDPAAEVIPWGMVFDLDAEAWRERPDDFEAYPGSGQVWSRATQSWAAR